MKTISTSYLLILAGFLAVLLMTSSCGDNSTGPDIDDTGQIDDPIIDDDDDTGDPIDPPPSDNFKIISDDVTETDDGFRFNGTLVGKNGNGVEFEIGDGEFDVVLDANGVIISISGTGLPEFPDIGIYKEILEDFAWEKIESHILYQKGSEFLEEFNTQVPLNPDRYYITYRVFDESKDGEFELRGIGNSIIHNFNEIYIDLEDPAIFLKFQLWKPSGKDATKVAEKFWRRAMQNAQVVGQNVVSYAGAPNMILGLSNTGTFLTPEYEPGIEDSEVFEDLYGFKGIESKEANMYLGLTGVPIPGTYVLRLNGEVYVHSPLIESVDGSGNIDSVLDWFNEFEQAPARQSYAGSMDFGGKGIGLILTGILPAVNDIVGRDIFSDDINIDLIEGFYQEEFLPDEPGNFRLGGGFQKPVIFDIFGPNIQQYLISQPDANGYIYLDVPDNLDESSLFIEQAQRMIVPAYGEIDLNDSHFKIDKNGFNFFARTGFDVGPIKLENALEGMFSGDGYSLSTLIERDITLPNDVVLTNRELQMSVSSDSGATVYGQIILPFSIGEARVNGQVSTDGLTMSGMVSQGSQLALTTGLNLPTRDLELTVSTDPDRILELYGETQIPFVGYNQVTGIINQNQYLFEGVVDRTLTFGSVEVPISNGSLLVDSQTGVFLDASYEIPFLASRSVEGEITSEQVYLAGAVNEDLSFNAVELPMSSGDITLNNNGAFINGTLSLPYNLRTSNVSGSITSSEMRVTGSMASALTFYGVNFPVTNSTLTASTTNGVTAAFSIRLNDRLNAQVTGSISQNGYSFTGSNNFVRGATYLGVSATVSGSILTRLTQNGIALTANGSLTYTGALGNTITVHSGNLTVQTDWQSRSVSVCVPGTNVCVSI
jgi:hypothetical protein